MEVTITDQVLCMTILCGLLQRHGNLIAEVDSTAGVDKLTVEFVESRRLQEEQRMTSPTRDSKETDAASLSTPASNCGSRSIPPYTDCKKSGHLELAY